MNPRSLVRQIVPFPVRLVAVRWMATSRWRRERPSLVLGKTAEEQYLALLAEHSSPLRREGTTYAEALQVAKETNVSLAAGMIDGLILPPGGVFSYHHAVGPPTRKRGFVYGPELRDESLRCGVGGGSCQVSNLLYVLALLSGMQIVERHRHGLDLFPDSGRTVPFGCGATVFFPLSDLRFRNPHDQAVRIGLTIEDQDLVGGITATRPIDKHFEIFEMESDMRHEGNVCIRENKVGRRVIGADGRLEAVEEVAHNVARCLYEPVTD